MSFIFTGSSTWQNKAENKCWKGHLGESFKEYILLQSMPCHLHIFINPVCVYTRIIQNIWNTSSYWQNICSFTFTSFFTDSHTNTLSQADLKKVHRSFQGTSLTFSINKSLSCLLKPFWSQKLTRFYCQVNVNNNNNNKIQFHHCQ